MQAPKVIHNFDEARSAFNGAKNSCVLLSAPDAAASLGVVGFLEMVSAAASENADIEYTAILDCGDQAGLALNALRLGAKDINVDLPPDVLAKIESIASQLGARVHNRPKD